MILIMMRMMLPELLEAQISAVVEKLMASVTNGAVMDE